MNESMLGLVTLSFCTLITQSTAVASDRISAEDLHTLLASGSEVLVINTLDKEYFDDCHIAGSVNIPLDSLEKAAADWNRSRRIVVYCASADCSVSGIAHARLSKMDFTNVQAYEGGTKEWKKKGFEVEGTSTSNN